MIKLQQYISCQILYINCEFVIQIFLYLDLPAFFLIASHTKPSDAPAEINHLDDVFVSASNYFSTSTGFILGDLNADCSYLSQTRYNTLDLVLNTSFTWWINNSVDTTTGTTNCAYDRFELTDLCIHDTCHLHMLYVTEGVSND